MVRDTQSQAPSNRVPLTAVNAPPPPPKFCLRRTSAVLLRSRCLQADESGGPCHLWGISDSPSGPSGRKRFQTPKSFLTAQWSGLGSQLLNSPISAIACRMQR